MKTEAEKMKRISFTMHKRFVSMLSDLAETNSGASMSHEVRRLIEDEWKRKFGSKEGDTGIIQEQ